MTSTALQAVLFDLDGTLIDTAPDFAVVVNLLLERHGKAELPYSAIRETVSHGARALITLAFELQEGDDGFEALRLELLELYGQHLSVETSLFPGMHELLLWLESNNIPWGIVTNKPRLYAEPILRDLLLSERCSALVCPDDVTHTKPDPEPLLLACEHIGCEAQQTLYIGDHRRDIEAGKNADMKTMAVNYGYIEADDPAENWQADFYVDHADEIQALLIQHF
ncbi:HAD-IA family hydrolase [Oceanicoccus sagamiensis]|uniref:Phosphoglycolate phosphatase n=1 Tax=Oceanicoccus sagamiensis TaxID=716816 RepID=A0A1X9NM95_9GAMM|nr:HAD-IA family hydrolase [Oceanicoccus sagamiensis]ARN75033.1 phosphoglycolate phosphatase [Oceanicoccus sagamiensis]